MALLITVASNRFNLVADNAYNWMTEHTVNYDKSWENTLSLWDGKWYIRLAENGYEFDPEGLSSVAFLPLLPFLLRIFTFVTSSYAASAVIINFLSLSGALYFLIKLSKEEKLNEIQTKNAVLFMLIYPTAIFWATVYTESLFVFTTIACFYFLKTKKYPLAGIFGMLAALTRVPGLFLIIPFLYFIWKNKDSIYKTLWSGLIPLGTVIYLLLQKIYTGNAFAFLTAQTNWGRKFFHFNPDHVYWETSAGIVNTSLDIMFALLLLSAIVFIYKKLNFGYASFCALCILVPLATGSLLSIGRFGMVLFPIFLALAKSKNIYLKKTYLITSLILLTFYTIQFVNGYWAG